jgi:hypothetical protein
MKQAWIGYTLGLGAALALAGCATEDTGTGDGGPDASDMDVTTMDVVVPPKDAGKDNTQPPVDSGQDTGAMDAGTDADNDGGTVTDAGSDAGDAGLPPVGSACNVPNQVQSQPCGICGTQYRACLAGGDGGYVWGPWGFCQNEVVGGCDPKLSYPDIDCNLCGKRKAVCLPNCTFDQTQQCQEPMNACIPGDTKFVLGLSCEAGGREAVCGNNCQLGNFGACIPQPSGLFIPTTVGQIATTAIQLTDSHGRLATSTTTACPLSTSFPTSTQVSYTYTKITNGTNQTALVSIWQGYALGSSSTVDTMIAIYRSASPPSDNDPAARRACSGSVEDGCTTQFSYQVGFYTLNACPTSLSFGGLMSAQGKGVSLAPGESIWVLSERYSGTTVTDMTLSVRTESLN